MSDNIEGERMNALFLGMANTNYENMNYFDKKRNRIYGQARRDNIRLKKFYEIFNMKCYTIDNKHNEIINEHLYGNFNNPRRFERCINNVFINNPIFKWIFLDYFFSPVSY